MKNMSGSGIPGAMGTSNGNVRQTSAPPGILNGNLSSESLASQELGMLLRSHSRLGSILNTREILNNARDSGSLHRSGSAPPSVEGSLASITGNYQLPGSAGAINSDIVDLEQLRADPSYLAYYYSHANLNPRLPPPLLTRERIHLVQQLAAGRLKALDEENNSGRSLFLSQSMLPPHPEQPELEDEKLGIRKQVRGDGSSAYASRSNSIASLLQDDASGTSAASLPIASNAAMNSRSATPNPLLSSRSTTPKPAAVHMLGNSAVGSGSRIQTSDQGGILAGTAELAARLQNINLSSPSEKQEEEAVQLQQALLRAQQQQNQNPHRFSGSESSSRVQARYSPSNSAASLQQQVAGATNNMAVAAALSYIAPNPYYPGLHAYAPLYGLGAYAAVNPSVLPAVMANYPSYDTTSTRPPASGSSNGGGVDVQQLYKYSSQAGVPMQALQDPLHYHYLQQYSVENARNALNLADVRGPYGSVDPLEIQKSQINSLLQLSRAGHYGAQPGSKSSSYAPPYYGAPGIGFMMPYGSSSISSPLLPGSPLVGNAFSLRQADPRIPIGAGKNNIYMGTSSESGEELKGSTLLEELKNNKTRKFELADIAGHVIEFSGDQHGSRFIQQKLETVSPEEKESVFKEVLPHAFSLMTDVFGNYVIQKFLEHGNIAQRNQLIEQLVGHVLPLTLQMYGCRVIQKALEVIDVEQQIKLISELDGHVMRCVRDQNGNHVIQKCIECVPPDHISFILSSFKGQVVLLSTHPYGCRVIQRVLEHCNDEQKQGGIMKEILEDVCTLAQDQYGNYVVQHILEHGRPEEKAQILAKMVGQIVAMSQHKFASNVVEKCLEFGGPAERQMLITEMLGQTDENEPLQAMMKDPFANYVVQKVLETCDDQQREVLLSRIRVHLHALKKYTYGKHIVNRVEKLVATGERRGVGTV